MSNEQLREIITKALDSFAEVKKHGRATDNESLAMANARQFAQHILDELEKRAASNDHHPGSIDLQSLRKLAPHAKGCQYVVDEDWAFCPKCGASLTPDVHFTVRVPVSALMTVDVVAGTKGKDYGINSDGTLEIMYSPEIEEGLLALFIEDRLYSSAKLSKATYGELLLWAKQQ